jgi:hypothetical protein
VKLVKDVLGGKKDITAEDVKQLVGMMCDLYDSQICMIHSLMW